ncbi:putative PROLIN-rich signal peptide protein [Candidatus Burkholderia humilis]|nr:putative PROLIN-rich signal peptide protein [Candidatus Burkholderia humilis]
MPLFSSRRPRPASGEQTVSVSDRPAPRRWGRWLLAILIVGTLHWSAMRWIERARLPSNETPQEKPLVQIELLTPKPIAPPAPVPKKPAPPKPAAAPKPQPAPVLSAVTKQPDAPAATSGVAASAPAQTAAASAPAPAPAPASQPAPAQAASGDKFSVPPSGELRYDTLVNGVMNQTGTIHWSNDGQHYEMVVSIPLPFVGPYVYSSKGHIDGFGIAPEQYSEQRGRRAADVAIFNRETKQIVHTKTPQSQPLADGAQDRFSVVMQLASLVRGNPDKYRPGVTRQFSVADNDSNEIWPIETIGDESVQARGGFTTARHFTRLPRREGDRRKLDIWLAPSLGWLPVRILQTEPNGMQIELLWAGNLQQPATQQSTPEKAPESAPSGTADASDESAPSETHP